jgi:hypothetical protein
MTSTRQNTIDMWRERLEAWKTSGKNIAKWCNDSGIPYARFFYWRTRLSKEQDAALNCSKSLPQFIEFTEPPQSVSNSGISLSFQEMQINLSRDFDRETLLKCLQTMKAL